MHISDAQRIHGPAGTDRPALGPERRSDIFEMGHIGRFDAAAASCAFMIEPKEEAMRTRLLILILTLAVGVGSTVVARADVVTEVIVYSHDGQALEGYLAYSDAVKGRRPGVLIVHEWWGLNDYVRKRAERLAAMGYVAFALDMYGRGRVTEHPKQAGEWATEISANVELWRARAEAGLEILKGQPQTDRTRIAAIGYCFGGSTVQQLAYSGAAVRGVVSFHGGPQIPPENAADAVPAKILLCHGAADPFVTPEFFQDYLTAMARSGLDYQVIVYGGAKHAFTNPDADSMNIPALSYNAVADRRSWKAMQVFFEEILR
jgi:dienelactone hydrolase